MLKINGEKFGNSLYMFMGLVTRIAFDHAHYLYMYIYFQTLSTNGGKPSSDVACQFKTHSKFAKCMHCNSNLGNVQVHAIKLQQKHIIFAF